MLTGLASFLTALLAVGLVACRWRQVAGLGTAVVCGAAVLVAMAAILTGEHSVLALPLGPGGMVLTLDPLAAFFLLPIGIAGAAAGFAARAAPLLPVFAATAMLTVLAGDPVTLVLGFTAMAACGWGLSGGAGLAWVATGGSACLLVGLTLLPQGSAPPDGWREAGVLVLTLLGAGSALGLAPLHRWVGTAHEAADGPICAMLTAAMGRVGLYLLIRILMDWCGRATPGWWCAPLLVMGLASALVGALRANGAPSLRGILGGLAVQNAGLMAVALGVALAARGADLPLLASLALGGAMLHALNQGVVQTLAALSLDAAERSAASQMLDRLGGLARAMPGVTACLLVAGASLAALPLSAGFAGIWVVLQTVIAAPRIGGLALQLTLTLVIAGLGLAIAIGAAAVVRLIGVGFLGRPRSPRAAAAEDPGRVSRSVLYTLAGLSAALGLLPGLGLALTNGARQALSAAGLQEATHWAGINAATDMPGYLPVGVAVLAALVALALWLWARRQAGSRSVAPWEGGFAAAPPWLPFGDPATQMGAASMTAPVMDVLGGRRNWVVALDRHLARAIAVCGKPASSTRPRLALAVLLALALVALAGVAWLEGA